MLSEESSRRNPAADLDATPFFAANTSVWAGVAPTLRGLTLPTIRLTPNSVLPEFTAVFACRIHSGFPLAVYAPDTRFAPVSPYRGAPFALNRSMDSTRIRFS